MHISFIWHSHMHPEVHTYQISTRSLLKFESTQRKIFLSSHRQACSRFVYSFPSFVHYRCVIDFQVSTYFSTPDFTSLQLMSCTALLAVQNIICDTTHSSKRIFERFILNTVIIIFCELGLKKSDLLIVLPVIWKFGLRGNTGI